MAAPLLMQEHNLANVDAGEGTEVSGRASIIFPERVKMGRKCRVDDFAYILASMHVDSPSVVLGDRVHIATHCSIGGGGRFEMGSYSGLAAGVRIVTGSHTGKLLINPCCPAWAQDVTRDGVIIGRHAVVYTGSIILPGVTIGEGAIVAAGAVVRHSLPGWAIYAGDPLRRIKSRDRNPVLAKEQELVERCGY